ncbi:hypothetical protein BH09VER1_BH09VER1_31190 [soil metagenome]
MAHRRCCFSLSLLPALCVALCVCEGKAAAQTIVNPGFEQDLTDWTSRFDRNNMSTAVPEAAHSGKLGLRITDDNVKAASSLESLAIEATPGQKFQVTFWARTVAGDGSVAVSLRFFDEKPKNLQKKPPSILFKQTPEWKQFTVTGVAPANSVGFVVVIHSLALETVTADLDDFECKLLQ